jgi:hypothetical protein
LELLAVLSASQVCVFVFQGLVSTKELSAPKSMVCWSVDVVHLYQKVLVILALPAAPQVCVIASRGILETIPKPLVMLRTMLRAKAMSTELGVVSPVVVSPVKVLEVVELGCRLSNSKHLSFQMAD